jgi:hypothetical protein
MAFYSCITTEFVLLQVVRSFTCSFQEATLAKFPNRCSFVYVSGVIIRDFLAVQSLHPASSFSLPSIPHSGVILLSQLLG